MVVARGTFLEALQLAALLLVFRDVLVSLSVTHLLLAWRLNSALRSLHEPEIIDAKREAAQRLLDTCPIGGGRFELTEDDAGSWLSAVNDIRLALGTMLDVGPDGPDRLPAGHPMAGHLDVYQWLTVLQEYLVLALMDRPGR